MLGLVWLRVAKDKAASFGGVTMQIYITKKFAEGGFGFDRVLRSENCRVELGVGIAVHTIQVRVGAVGAPVATLDPVRIQARNDLEHKLS